MVARLRDGHAVALTYENCLNQKRRGAVGDAEPRGDRSIRAFLTAFAQCGPTGAFAQEYTVMRNTLSDHKL